MSDLKILILSKAKLDYKAGNKQVFFFLVTGMTGQNRHSWLDLFCKRTFFEVFG